MELVTAVIVTRGDVELAPIFESLPTGWSVFVWDNSFLEDLSVYGRYAALDLVETDLVYVQDDDVIVSNPQKLIDAWQPGHVVCNMPQQFRHDGYTDSALVGFGACFERDLPAQAFARYWGNGGRSVAASVQRASSYNGEMFRRCADVVFTTLTPRILVDVPKTDREFASDPGRMWKQPGHVAERTRMLELARKVRDA